MKKLKVAVIREELVALTGDYKTAIVLNQMIYWSERVEDADRFLAEEKRRAKKSGTDDIELMDGWIYKSAEELSSETMMGLSKSNMRAQIKRLVDAGFMSERNNPKYKWDKTKQYRVNIVKIQTELIKLGYSLEGYPLNVAVDTSSEIEPRGSEIEHRGSETKHGGIETEHRSDQNRTAIPETTSKSTSKITSEEREQDLGGGLKLDKDFGRIAKEYEQRGFGCPGNVKDRLGELLGEYSVEWISEAFKRSAVKNVRTLNYAEGILRNWRAKGGMDSEVKKDGSDRVSNRGPEKENKSGITAEEAGVISL